MTDEPNIFHSVSPEAVLQEIVAALPEECRKNIVIIGSLAVGYHYFRGQSSMVVRTKYADCLLSPRIEAIQAGVAATEKLFENHWEFRKDDRWIQPGTADTPTHELPAARMNPPGSPHWFIELLTVPEATNDRRISHTRIATRFGHFSLVSFGFLSLMNYEPIKTSLGICIARPEMMALANLLSHPEIESETMKGLIASREIKRSNKDLGRVLAIAILATNSNEDALLEWPRIWGAALQDRYPKEWKRLASLAGQGLRQMIASESDLEEARHTCEWGLLASNPPTAAALRIAGRRLIQDAIAPLEALAAD